VPKKKRKIATLIVIFCSVILLLCLIGMCVPGFESMQRRSMRQDVLTVMHTVRDSVEYFRNTHHGRRPEHIGEVESLIPEFVRKKQNPYNPKQSYSVAGGGLVDGEPTRDGEVGYIVPKDSTKPYQIVSFRKDDTLRLTEEMATAKVNSSGTKSP